MSTVAQGVVIAVPATSGSHTCMSELAVACGPVQLSHSGKSATTPLGRVQPPPAEVRPHPGKPYSPVLAGGIFSDMTRLDQSHASGNI